MLDDNKKKWALLIKNNKAKKYKKFNYFVILNCLPVISYSIKKNNDKGQLSFVQTDTFTMPSKTN